MKERFVWCERAEQWRARELGKCYGCGRGKGKGCVKATHGKPKEKKRVDTPSDV